MPVVIKNRFTQEVILVVDAESLKGANLEGANLRFADLYSENLEGANLRGANLRNAFKIGRAHV